MKNYSILHKNRFSMIVDPVYAIYPYCHVT